MTLVRDERRFAIYYAPRIDSELSRFGVACLGRDAATGVEFPPPLLDGLSAERWHAITESPRRYGFHATLKPPFHLAPGRTVDELRHRLERFADERRPFEAGPLSVARISNFLAFVLRAPSPPLCNVAKACVSRFDDFRATPSEAELQRRRSDSLTPRQRALLDTWGYPYVFEEWRFHMTLASGLETTEADHVCDVLREAAGAACDAPLEVDAVCLFEQASADAPFRLVRRFPFGGALE
jgi:putative phosphonate metabolism protein